MNNTLNKIIGVGNCLLAIFAIVYMAEKIAPGAGYYALAFAVIVNVYAVLPKKSKK